LETSKTGTRWTENVRKWDEHIRQDSKQRKHGAIEKERRLKECVSKGDKEDKSKTKKIGIR
jgi:hypothetical protein